MLPRRSRLNLTRSGCHTSGSVVGELRAVPEAAHDSGDAGQPKFRGLQIAVTGSTDATRADEAVVDRRARDAGQNAKQAILLAARGPAA